MKKSPVLLIAAALLLSSTAYAEVKIAGDNTQKTNVQGAIINSAAGALTTATQNVSSNKGNVKIGGDNKQITDVQGAVINSAAGALATAEQNVSSNDGE